MSRRADLSGLATEQVDPASRYLDEMSVSSIVSTMNSADFAIPAVIRAALTAITEAIDAAETGFSAGGRLIYVGAGTSGRLGVLDAAECPPTFGTDPSRVVGLIAGGPQALVEAVEGAEDDDAAGADDVGRLGVGPLDTVVGIAASGRTPYVKGALVRAHVLGAITVSVSCTSPAELSGVAEHPIEIQVGPEVLSGSTRLKAGTAQKQLLNMISTALMVRTGHSYGNLMVDLSVTNAKLLQRAVGLVSRIAQVDEAAAAAALESANSEVKTAIVMVICGAGAERARALLAEVDGRLGAAIGIPSSSHPGLGTT